MTSMATAVTAIDQLKAELQNVTPRLILASELALELARLSSEYRDERDTAESLVEELREENTELRCRMEELAAELDAKQSLLEETRRELSDYITLFTAMREEVPHERAREIVDLVAQGRAL